MGTKSDIYTGLQSLNIKGSGIPALLLRLLLSQLEVRKSLKSQREIFLKEDAAELAIAPVDEREVVDAGLARSERGRGGHRESSVVVPCRIFFRYCVCRRAS